MNAGDVFGVDFTSRPGRSKAIVIAGGRMLAGVLVLDSLVRQTGFAEFEAWLRRPGPWVAGFDFPFSLPRPLIEAYRWPAHWPELMCWLARQERADLRDRFRAWCDARPPGAKFAHRACDIPAGASPSMKWVNPPVAWMLKEGAPRLLSAGVSIPGLHAGDPQRVALEAYPGFVVRQLTRASYKSDDAAKQTPERAAARQRIVDGLAAGAVLGIGLRLESGLRRRILEDGTGDALDAVICAMQAAWGWQRRERKFGLPMDVDPLEGWIVSVPTP